MLSFPEINGSSENGMHFIMSWAPFATHSMGFLSWAWAIVGAIVTFGLSSLLSLYTKFVYIFVFLLYLRKVGKLVLLIVPNKCYGIYAVGCCRVRTNFNDTVIKKAI